MAPTFEVSPTQKNVRNERIEASNWCAMFFYNIPRASLMLTVPGLAIVVTGAAMVAFADRDQPWTVGLSLIALICLVVGGVWTLAAIVYWIAAWCRFRPPLSKRPPSKRSTVAPPVADDTDSSIEIRAVYKYPPDGPVRTVTGSLDMSMELNSLHGERVFVAP